MSRLPALFISHGAPDLPIRTGAVQAFLQQLPQETPRPQAILVVSAHWNSPHSLVSTAANPATIYDFSGFPESLHQITYPAPGAPDLAERVIELLTAAGLQAKADPSRGLDHGAWTPLMLAYPKAEIPVT
ncbi:MAG: dioxygenase, partial [Cyanobacteria bacterium Co-bin8]|nr:dioxygenase [Cyanobacteria bacterium Co-bin8]